MERPFEPFDRFAHVERDQGVPLPALIDRFVRLRGEQPGRLRELVGETTSTASAAIPSWAR